MDEIRLTFSQTYVPEWHEMDSISKTLGNNYEKINTEEKKDILDNLHFYLPATIDPQKLTGYNVNTDIPIPHGESAEPSDVDYYLIQVPLSMMIPENIRITQFKLTLELDPEKYNNKPIFARDIYPKTTSTEEVLAQGEICIDVAKGLAFVPVAGGILKDSFGLKLSHPIEWKTTHLTIQAAGEMNNPIIWEVSDKAIYSKFRGYAIIQTPKGADVQVHAKLTFQVAKYQVFKTEFKSPSYTYPLTAK